MKFNLKIRHFFGLIISLFFLSGFESVNFLELRIINSYMTAPMEGVDTFAAYMSITNISIENIFIIKISCPNIKKAYLHDIKVGSKNGMISMEKMDSLLISPGETVDFKPGGKHIMIVGLKVPLNLNDGISCSLRTRKGMDFPVFFTVR